jgi:hypothetical protein
MPDDADFIERCESKLWQIVYEMHKAGVRFEIVHQILKEMAETLDMQSYCEEWLRRYNQEK